MSCAGRPGHSRPFMLELVAICKCMKNWPFASMASMRCQWQLHGGMDEGRGPRAKSSYLKRHVHDPLAQHLVQGCLPHGRRGEAP